MPKFCDIIKITRKQKGKKRKSNLLTKKLAEIQAKKDMKEEMGETNAK